MRDNAQTDAAGHMGLDRMSVAKHWQLDRKDTNRARKAMSVALSTAEISAGAPREPASVHGSDPPWTLSNRLPVLKHPTQRTERRWTGPLHPNGASDFADELASDNAPREEVALG